MVLRQKQIPQSQLLGLGLELFENWGVDLPSLVAFTKLGFEDIISGDAVLFDKLLDLYDDLLQQWPCIYIAGRSK